MTDDYSNEDQAAKKRWSEAGNKVRNLNRAIDKGVNFKKWAKKNPEGNAAFNGQPAQNPNGGFINSTQQPQQQWNQNAGGPPPGFQNQGQNNNFNPGQPPPHFPPPGSQFSSPNGPARSMTFGSPGYGSGPPPGSWPVLPNVLPRIDETQTATGYLSPPASPPERWHNGSLPRAPSPRRSFTMPIIPSEGGVPPPLDLCLLCRINYPDIRFLSCRHGYCSSCDSLINPDNIHFCPACVQSNQRVCLRCQQVPPIHFFNICRHGYCANCDRIVPDPQNRDTCFRCLSAGF